MTNESRKTAVSAWVDRDVDLHLDILAHKLETSKTSLATQAIMALVDANPVSKNDKKKFNKHQNDKSEVKMASNLKLTRESASSRR